jgi:hypothetical protein
LGTRDTEIESCHFGNAFLAFQWTFVSIRPSLSVSKKGCRKAADRINSLWIYAARSSYLLYGLLRHFWLAALGVFRVKAISGQRLIGFETR